MGKGKGKRAAAKKAAKAEERARVTTGLDAWFAEPDTTAGERVDERSALTYSAVYRAVALISGTCATLPIHVYRKTAGGRERQSGHPVETLLNVSPNGEQDACSFRETHLSGPLLWGVGPAEVERDKLGRPLALWSIEPSRFHQERDDAGRLRYRVDPCGPTSKGGVFAPEDFVVVEGQSFGGYSWCSPIRMAREAIGLGLAAERFGAKLFGEGGVPAGVFTTDGVLTDSRYEQLKGRLNRDVTGRGNARKTPLLEGGLKFTAISVPPEDAQFLETRRFQVGEIARWYGLPPHLLGDLERATFSNIEEQNLYFVMTCLRYWITKSEQAYGRRLLTREEQEAGYYIEYLLEDLLRGNTATRYDAYQKGRMMGLFSINDTRRAENLPGIGPAGDGYLVPTNMTSVFPGDPRPAVAAAAPPPPAPAPAAEETNIDAGDSEGGTS